MAKLPVVGGFNELPEKQSACETTVNMFPEKVDGKSAWRLASAPGLTRFTVLPSSGALGMRGMWEAAGRAFCVAGDKFYEIFANGSFVERGTLLTTAGVVSMDDNGLQVGMVDGTYGYVFTLATNAFTRILDVDFKPSPLIVVSDAVGICIEYGTQRFFHSGINDLLSWSALDFISAEGNPDALVALGKDVTGLLLWGTRSLDLYYCTGDDPYYAQREGSGSGYGAVSPYSVQKLGDSWIWVGNDANGNGGVFKVTGMTPRKISDAAVDRFLQDRKNVLAQARAWAYRQNGHEFYLLNIPGTSTTLVYDGATDIWHERKSFDANGVMGRYRAEWHVFAFGLNLVGDYATNAIYVLDPSVNTDDGKTLLRSRTLTPIYDETDYRPVSFVSLTLDVLVGVGDEQGSDPQLVLEVSNDGGVTYDVVRTKSIGKRGKYSQIVQYRRLGRSRNRVFRLSFGYDAPFAVNNAFLEAGF